MLVCEGVALGCAQIETVRHALEAIFGSGLQADQAAAMREQCAQVANVLRRNPHFGEQVGAQQMRQAEHVDFVGLDARERNSTSNDQGVG